MKTALQKLRARINWLRWGALREEVRDSLDGWCVTEVAYLDRNGRVVGYWAYGCFDPSMPFHGQPHTIMAQGN